MYTAVILAAGEARRMGALKQLLPWEKSTVLETVIKNVLKCDLIDDQTRVVLGAGREKIKPRLKKISDNNLKIRENPAYKEGMISTIRTGIKDLPSSTQVLLFVLGDQPLITPQIFSKCIDQFQKSRSKMLVPTHKGQNGHPVIVSTELIPEIKKLNGPGGLRGLFDIIPEEIEYYPLDDKRIVIDFDFYDEYKRYRSREQNKRGYNLNYKFWLEGDKKVFGDGPCDILQRIDRFGSLRRAAEDMKMSYSQAWNLINKLEDRLGFKLIKKQAGGRSGGGSKLTEKGRVLLDAFLAFRREIHYKLTELEDKYFNEELWDKLQQ